MRNSRLFLIFVAAFTLGTSSARAEAPADDCARRFVDVRPAFDPSVVLERAGLRVWYGDRSFVATPLEYVLLQTILTATREAVGYDALILRAWGAREPRDPLNTIHTTLRRLRRKFKYLDGDFDQIRFNRGESVYWTHPAHARRTRGRVGVAKYVHLGYADGASIGLTPNQHAILTAALRGGSVSADRVGSINAKVFKQMVCGLNRRFQPSLNQRLLRAEWGHASYSIDPELLRPRRECR